MGTADALTIATQALRRINRDYPAEVGSGLLAQATLRNIEDALRNPDEAVLRDPDATAGVAAGTFVAILTRYERAHDRIPHQVRLEQPKTSQQSYAGITLDTNVGTAIDPLVKVGQRVRVTFEVLTDG